MLRNRRAVYDNRFTNPWWLAGGIAESACTGVWQPIGAPNYEASKINLANRGLYDAYEGVAPSWDKNNGWYFDRTQYLKTLVSINRTGQTKSLIARFSGHPTGTNYRVITGAWGGTGTKYGRFWLTPEWGADKVGFANGREGLVTVTGGYNSGVMAVADNDGYYNGSDVCDMSVGDVAGTAYLYIGATSYDGANVSNSYIGYIQAVAVYATTSITYAQVLAVTNAVNAL